MKYLDFCKAPTDYYPIATGFTLPLCELSLLVSNRHVLSGARNAEPLFVRARMKSGDLIRMNTSEVHHHPDPNVDLAAAKLQYPRSVAQEDIVIGIVSEDAARTRGHTSLTRLDTLRAGDEAVFAGVPVAIVGVRSILADRERPLTRSGVVSLVLPGETRIGRHTVRDVFLMDSWAFGGNSGSPVVLPPTNVSYDDDDRDRQRARVAGVVSAFLDFDAPIERAVVVGGVSATVNSGLAIVQSLDGIELVAEQFEGAACAPVAAPATEAPAADSQQ